MIPSQSPFSTLVNAGGDIKIYAPSKYDTKHFHLVFEEDGLNELEEIKKLFQNLEFMYEKVATQTNKIRIYNPHLFLVPTASYYKICNEGNKFSTDLSLIEQAERVCSILNNCLLQDPKICWAAKLTRSYYNPEQVVVLALIAGTLGKNYFNTLENYTSDTLNKNSIIESINILPFSKYAKKTLTENLKPLTTQVPFYRYENDIDPPPHPYKHSLNAHGFQIVIMNNKTFKELFQTTLDFQHSEVTKQAEIALYTIGQAVRTNSYFVKDIWNIIADIIIKEIPSPKPISNYYIKPIIDSVSNTK